MRECTVITPIKIVRTDEELEDMWNSGTYYKQDMYTRAKFFRDNREYWIKREVHGMFHQWGVDFEEFDSGPGNYTVAIVELDDGTIVTPTTTNIKFATPMIGGNDNGIVEEPIREQIQGRTDGNTTATQATE